MKIILYIVIFFSLIAGCKKTTQYRDIKKNPIKWQKQKQSLIAELSTCSLDKDTILFEADFAHNNPLKYPYFDNPEAAFSTLLNTEIFAGTYAGSMGGSISQQAIAFNVLLKQTDSKTAFLQLLQRANLAGQLYGLCGLYFLDKTVFYREVKKYSLINDSVYTEYGCCCSSCPVKEIVKSSAIKTICLNPDQTKDEWYIANYGKDWKNNKEARDIGSDIIGGSIPQDLKYAGVLLKKHR